MLGIKRTEEEEENGRKTDEDGKMQACCVGWAVDVCTIFCSSGCAR